MPIETRRKYGRIPTRQTRAPAMQPSFAAALAELVAGASGPPEIALPDDYRQPVITPERVGSTLHNALPDAAPNVGTTPNRRRMPMLPGLDASAEPIFRQDVGRSAMARALEEYMPDRTAAVVGERNVRHFDPSSGGPAPD
ncbi:MAG TPA: hypothetical protein VMW52_04760, partial [Phycisphaerae bacterium]|nr:hypothetical protein [Phycisphaerae bacterium]